MFVPHETGAGHESLEFRAGKAGCIKIAFHSSFCHGALQKMKRLMRMIGVLAAEPETSIRFQDTEYFRKRPGLALYPMKNAVQIYGVKACVGEFRQILGPADPRLEIAGGP